MESNLLYEFDIDRSSKTIYILREFSAAKSIVWKAFTDAKNLNKWWAPSPYTLETKIMDFKEGGKWLYAMVSPEGEKHYGIANYISIGAENYYIQRDGFCDENGEMLSGFPENEALNSFLEINDESGLRTQVTMKMTFDTVEDLEKNLEMGFQEGISVCFEQLDDLLES